MRIKPTPFVENYRVCGCGNNGIFSIRWQGVILFVISSDGDGWDHVSVSPRDDFEQPIKSPPSWDEMCFVKDQFFRDDETVVQFHPKKSEYVNDWEWCLHLWRYQGADHMLPPREMV